MIGHAQSITRLTDYSIIQFRRKTVEKPGRREVIFLLGSAAATTLVGRAGATPAAGASAAQTAPGCVITPEQTEGPYFVDEGLNRSDIRIDPSTGTVKAGV